jgi:tetratricopeptide (TPR) repeat protein
MFQRAQPRPILRPRFQGAISRYTLVSFAMVSLLPGLSIQAYSLSSLTQAQPDRIARSLEIGKPLERELSSNQTHVYQLTLLAGQYFRASVYQIDIPVTATLVAHDGKKIFTADSPVVAFGMETVSLIADTAGRYRIEIRAKDQAVETGRYEIKLEELRAATLTDKERLAAERLFLEAEQLSAPSSAQSLHRALGKYEEALRINRNLNDRFAEAITLHSLGLAFDKLGDKAKALDSCQRALAIFQSFGNRGWDSLFNNLAPLYLIMGGKQQALHYLADALPLVRAVHNKRLEAMLLTGLAKIYDDLNDQQQALAHYQQALLLFRVIGKRSDEAITLTQIADADLSLAEREKAIAYLLQALPIIRAVGDRNLEATVRFGIGYVYNLLDERQKALEYYEQALPIFRALSDRNGEAYMLSFIGGFYSSLGEEQKALDYYEQALPLFRALNDRKGEAYTLLRLGAAYRQFDEREKTLDFLTQALALMRATGERVGEAQALNLIGAVYYSSGETQKALDTFNQALLLWRATGYRDGEAFTLVSLGFTYELSGKPQQAMDCHKQALALFRILGTRYGEAGARFGMARIEYARGNLAEARKQIEGSLEIIESLRAKLAGQEMRASFLASNQHFYNFYIDVLMQLNKRQPAKGFDGEALQASERARARSLLEILTESGANIRQGVDPLLLERERNLQQQLNAKEQLRMQLSSRKLKGQQLAKVEKEIRAITTAYQEVQAQIRVNSPRYAALTQPQPLTLKEIQQQTLDPDTLLLEYALGEERSYLWAVSSSAIASFELPGRAEIEKAARSFYLALSTQNQPLERRGDTEGQGRGDAATQRIGDPEWQRRGADSTKNRATKNQAQPTAQKLSATEAAALLSKMLLAPVASMLSTKRLLIVADGALQYIPFAALPLPAPEVGRKGVEEEGRKSNRISALPTSPAPHLPYFTPLIVEHEIINLPSASTLALLRRETAGRKMALKTIAVLADPVFTSEDARVKRNAPQADGKNSERAPVKTRAKERPLEKSALESAVGGFGLQIPRLMGTRLEASGILDLVPESQRKQALDFNASRATATSPELGQYSIIHFATHGLLNSVHPELSGIVLSLVDEQGQAQDGFLRLHEIYNLRLPVELVVLSACQTGLGKQIKGEGLVGLTRGFMYAGAPRVVASLWKVDDEATAELMKLFYKGMVVEELRPAAALRAAQVAMWKQTRWQEPYYWAAFMLQGEWK